MRFELPAPVTSLIGRQQEIAELGDLLQRQGTRLVTVTGLGGSGKSRVALALAERMRDSFANGVAFVDLAPIDDPRLVVVAIAQQLGVVERADEDLLQTLARWLGPRELLIVLDNFERVVDAGPTLVELLKRAPMLAILATSRRVLQLSAEHVFPLRPLPLDDAVQVFATRALARDPTLSRHSLDSESGREICQRVDCLPLAVELAAAQVGTLGIENLRERLDKPGALLAAGPRDLPARQRTLHDTLTWSTDLLSLEERMQFARLGVFSGGGNAEAALAVAGGTAESLAALADHSLLRVSEGSGEMRFSMLETVRNHALELLAGSAARDEARNAHAEHFASLIERIDPRAEETSTRLRLIDLDIETVLGLAALGRGRLDEARTHIARSGALARGLGLEADVVIADTNLAEISFRAGDLDDARRRWEGVLAWHEHGSAPESGVFALLGLAAIAHAEDRLDEAERLFGRALHLADTAGFAQLAGHAHIGLAAVAAKSGNHVEAANRLGRADAMFAEFSGRSAEFDRPLVADTEASARAALGENAFTTAYEAGLRGTLERPHTRLSRN